MAAVLQVSEEEFQTIVSERRSDWACGSAARICVILRFSGLSWQIQVVGQDSGYVDGPRPFANGATSGSSFNVCARVCAQVEKSCGKDRRQKQTRLPNALLLLLRVLSFLCGLSHVPHAEAKERAREDELERLGKTSFPRKGKRLEQNCRHNIEKELRETTARSPCQASVERVGHRSWQQEAKAEGTIRTAVRKRRVGPVLRILSESSFHSLQSWRLTGDSSATTSTTRSQRPPS